MSEDTIKRSDAIKALDNAWINGTSLLDANEAVKQLKSLPSADRPKHYCAECKYEPIDKRCMPCSSCINNPKNRDAFVSCEVEVKGADDEEVDVL